MANSLLNDTPCYAQIVGKLICPNTDIDTKICKVCYTQDDQSKTAQAQNETGDLNGQSDRNYINTIKLSMDNQDSVGCYIPVTAQAQNETINQSIIVY